MALSDSTQRKYEIDWRRFPSVVFESDDWGACESAVGTSTADEISKLHKRLLGNNYSNIATLETPAQLERLYQTLEKYRGVDGLPVVFTAFICTGNPDFKKIRANNYMKYEDIGLDKGVPESWERGDIAGKLRNGFERGIFHPEFHSNLHHTSPHLWLQRLRENSRNGEFTRSLFNLECYVQGEHLPEYFGMNVKMQNEWIKIGIERFKNIFGFIPEAAVTSDAFPETETVWSINGIKTVCLKNCRCNSGETVVYVTKPWNLQNVYSKIGDYNEMNDIIYVTRNAFFESGIAPSRNDSARTVLEVVKRNTEMLREPSIISTHRVNYVSLNGKTVEKRYSELEKLLTGLSKMKVNFLTTSEVGQLYRQGWSTRKYGNEIIFRKWHEGAYNVDIISSKTIIELKERRLMSGVSLSEIPLGSYLLKY